MRTLGLKVIQTVCGSAVVTSSEEQEEAGCEVAQAQQRHVNLAQLQALRDLSSVTGFFFFFFLSLSQTSLGLQLCSLH